MLALTNVVAAVRAMIGDKSSLIVEDTELLVYTRMAVTDVIRQTKSSRLWMSPVPVTGGGGTEFVLAELNPEVFIEIERVIISDLDTGLYHTLQYMSPEQLDMLFPNRYTEFYNAPIYRIPQYYWVNRHTGLNKNGMMIQLWPISDHTLNVHAWYLAIPSVVNLTAVIDVPGDYEHAVLLFLLWKCRQQLEQWEQAEMSKRDYETELLELEHNNNVLGDKYPSVTVLPGDYGDNLYGPY